MTHIKDYIQENRDPFHGRIVRLSAESHPSVLNLSTNQIWKKQLNI
jgi:hypothetical protein